MSRKLVELSPAKPSQRRQRRATESVAPRGKGPASYSRSRLPLTPPPYPRYLRFRRASEAALALAGLVVLAPVFAAAALLIKLTSRGPVIYAQARVGHNGRIFTMFKFRSMIHNCESLTGPRWAIPGDPRVTPLGAFLRRSHIDELPQLWNVLRGDMSLIGPRPERPEFVQRLKRALPQYEGRQGALPGITGLAQVQLPPDSDLESVRRKLACDLFYVANVTPWLDVRVFLATLARAAGVPFPVLRALLRLPTWQSAERSITVGEENLAILPEIQPV